MATGYRASEATPHVPYQPVTAIRPCSRFWRGRSDGASLMSARHLYHTNRSASSPGVVWLCLTRAWYGGIVTRLSAVIQPLRVGVGIHSCHAQNCVVERSRALLLSHCPNSSRVHPGLGHPEQRGWACRRPVVMVQGHAAL